MARLEDLAKKWMKWCTSVEELKDMVIQEQLVNTLPDDVRASQGEKTQVKCGSSVTMVIINIEGVQKVLGYFIWGYIIY